MKNVISESPKNQDSQKLLEKEALIGKTQRAVAQHGIIRNGQEIIANLDKSSSSKSNGSGKMA